MQSLTLGDHRFLKLDELQRFWLLDLIKDAEKNDLPQDIVEFYNTLEEMLN